VIVTGLPLQPQPQRIVGSAKKEDGDLCVSLRKIRLHRGPVWCSDITAALSEN